MLSVWVKYCVLLQEFQESDHNFGFLGIGLITEKPVHTNAVLNRLSPRQNVRHFADKSSFLNDNWCTLMQISHWFVHKGPINNKIARPPFVR